MVATLGTLDPRQQQAEQRQRMTAQQVAAEQELARSLQHSAVTPGEGFTSPFQAAGQMAQALAGRNKMNQVAAAQASLNANGPFGGASSGEAAEPPFQPSNEPGGTPGLAQGSSKFRPFAPEVKQAIVQGSQAAGVDPREMAVYAHIESDGDPGAGQHGHYKGLMQLSPEEMARVSGGKGNIWNPQDSTMAAASIMKENKAAFEQRYGRPATAFDGYMMHQQGQAGYFHHLDNPDAPAWQNMYATAEGRSRGEQWAQHAITGNGGHMSDTSGQFLGRWQQRFNNAGAGDHGAFADVAGANNPQVPPIGGPGAQVAQANIPQASAAPGASAPPSGTGAPGGAGVPGQPPGATPPGAASANPPGIPPGAIRPTTQNGLMTGTIYDPAILPKPPPMPFRSMDELRMAVNRGIIGGPEAEHYAQVMQQGTQPQTMELPGGTLRWNPQNPLQQTYIPKPQIKPVKVGDIETQQPFYYDPYGRRMDVPNAPTAPAGAPAAPGSPAAPAGAGTPPAAPPAAGGAPSIEQAVRSGNLDELSQAGIARGAEKTTAEENAKNQSKQFNAVYTGITGAGDNAAHQAQNLDLLRQIAPAAFTGSGADTMLSLNRLADRVGLGTDRAAAPRELFNAIAAKVLQDQFSALRNLNMEEGSAAMRVFKSMLEVEEKANFNPNDSLQGTMAKLRLLEQSGKQAMKWADMADDEMEKKHSLGPSFMKKLRKDISESRITDVFGEGEGKEPAAATPAAPSTPAAPAATKTIEGKTYYQRNGKWFTE